MENGMDGVLTTKVVRCTVSMIRGSVLFNKPLAWAIFSGDQAVRTWLVEWKRLVFVEDSLNMNMWELLIYSLRESLLNKSKLFEVSGHYESKTQSRVSLFY